MGFQIRNIWDSFLNIVTGLGTVKDPSQSAVYTLNLLDRNSLDNAYRGDWIARKIVDAPAEDATREWRDWQASQDQIEAIEDVEKTHQIQMKMKQALIRARLYGGAALVIGVAQGQPWEEIDLEKVGEGDLKYVVVMHRWELSAGPRIYDAMSPWYTQPEYYTVATQTAGLISGNEPVKAENGGMANLVSTGMVKIHPSRIVLFTGNEMPDWRLSPLGGGWGDSVLQTVDDTIKDIGMITGGMANMVNDAKMDVISIPELNELLATDEYSKRLLNRLQMANMMKSSINTLVTDEREKWTRTQTNFSGLPNLLHEFLSVVAGAADIPVSRLVGQSPGHGLGAGAGSGGSDVDLRNYYDRIKAMQNTEYTPRMRIFDEVIIRSATGTRDDAIHHEWTPLWQLSEKEKADIAKVKADTMQVVVNTALINEDAMRQAYANQMIEDQTWAGLEDAIDEHGLEPDIIESRQWSPMIDPNTGMPISAPVAGGVGGGGDNPLMLPAPDEEDDTDTDPQDTTDAAPRTLYVRRDVLNGDDIKAWAEDQGFPTSVEASEMHVTLVYSKEPIDWMKVGSDYPNFQVSGPNGKNKTQFLIPEGGPRIVDKLGNAIVLLFASSQLQWRHSDMLRAGATSDYLEYQPHITITYEPGTFDWTLVEPYRGEIILGPEIFEEIKTSEFRPTEDGGAGSGRHASGKAEKHPQELKRGAKTYYATGKVGTHRATGEQAAEYRHYGPNGDQDECLWRTTGGKIAHDAVFNDDSLNPETGYTAQARAQNRKPKRKKRR